MAMDGKMSKEEQLAELERLQRERAEMYVFLQNDDSWVRTSWGCKIYGRHLHLG
jgi:hypothetical protein